MKIDWTNKLPVEEGWYFWRRRNNQSDPFTWLAFYVLPPDLTNENPVEYWSGGDNVPPPTGGWWTREPIYPKGY
jgi:hypothetical protein